jgi:hypothetical protein
MLYKINDHYIQMMHLGDFGCFVAVEKGVLYSCPAVNTTPPEPDLEAYTAVGCVDTEGEAQGRAFLNQVNQIFGSKFNVNDPAFDAYRMATIKF